MLTELFRKVSTRKWDYEIIYMVVKYIYTVLAILMIGNNCISRTYWALRNASWIVRTIGIIGIGFVTGVLLGIYYMAYLKYRNTEKYQLLHMEYGRFYKSSLKRVSPYRKITKELNNIVYGRGFIEEVSKNMSVLYIFQNRKIKFFKVSYLKYMISEVEIIMEENNIEYSYLIVDNNLMNAFRILKNMGKRFSFFQYKSCMNDIELVSREAFVQSMLRDSEEKQK